MGSEMCIRDRYHGRFIMGSKSKDQRSVDVDMRAHRMKPWKVQAGRGDDMPIKHVQSHASASGRSRLEQYQR